MTGNEQMIGEGSTRLARKLPAGMVDASLASLATFTVGITAANLLDARDLGVYAVFFTAFMFATVLPRNLIFTPAEVTAVSRPVPLRMKLLAQSIRLGLPLALIGATSVLIAAVITRSLTDPSVVTALVATTGAAAILSPIQDHVRKMLHIADHSWLAAAVSTVQVTVAVLAVIAMIVANVAVPWIPFGALTIANAASLTVGLILALRVHATGGRPRLRFRELATSGKWLLLQSLAPSVAGFIVAAVIVRLAGPEALGYAEAARVVAQPVIVLATGLTAVLAPRIMEASMIVNLSAAQRLRRIYLTLVVLAGVGYLAVAGTSWWLNPMQYLVPAAYVVPGLVAFTVVANTFTAAEFLQVNELLGARLEKALMVISFIASPILVIVSFSAAVTGSFARSLGELIEAWSRLAMQGWRLRKHYAEDAPATSATSATG
jgi:O-antigen/teichoic acid export membrane protein